MPRYFFHIHDDLDCPDLEGSELPDLDAARRCASKEANLLMCELLKQESRIALNHYIDIEDGAGSVLETVSFRDVVKIEG